MRWTLFPIAVLVCSIVASSSRNSVKRAAPPASLPILASTTTVESDKVFFYYASQPQLIGNDGSADKGGFHVYDINSAGNGTSLPEAYATVTGRTKVVSAVYDVNGADHLVTFSTPEHTLRFYDLATREEVASKFILAEFSALCGWQSPATGEQYIYLFGKKQVKMYLLQTNENGFEPVEVVSFVVPIEAETCAIPVGHSEVLFGGNDKKLYTFPASDVSTTPAVMVSATTEEEIVGAAVYHLAGDGFLYLVAFEESISVYSSNLTEIGTITIEGEGFELSDIAIFQNSIGGAPSGSIGYAFESDDLGKAFGVSSLDQVFTILNINQNIEWSPRTNATEVGLPTCPTVNNCGVGGICSSQTSCACYSGFTGADCSQITCLNDCSGNGLCRGANNCECNAPFTGDDCSVFSVTAVYETDASGADGDDPAIWLAADPTVSRIITTTKSEDNPGLTLFDLEGNKLQSISASEPNNVDIIYSFPLSPNKTTDLAYAGCRGDNTLCLFAISANGTLSNIPGGSQPLPEDFEVYGSCVYHRARDSRFFLFANSKEAVYLQYELTSSNGSLSTTLVRTLMIGTGTQPEGCVVDDANEVIFIGEESFGLWKYSANPEDAAGNETLVDSVDKAAGGKMDADVEGMALVTGATSGEGYLIVSMQGVSAYNVYERAAPHAFVKRFSIADNVEAGVDHVTNTDGVAAVGNNLGGAFSGGLIVVHDDANERPDGTTDAAASFKLVSLGDVINV
ncbi:hypothetical protein B0O99DRAFT_618200 [Bisporella sp. PMI_857]|nr:hypothetical protein B0O99DRAFT_618200 [Bisporella sp. PMI_857]